MNVQQGNEIVLIGGDNIAAPRRDLCHLWITADPFCRHGRPLIEIEMRHVKALKTSNKAAVGVSLRDDGSQVRDPSFAPSAPKNSIA